MVAITRKGNDYRMKFSSPGTGWKSYAVMAKDLDEVKHALEHHYVWYPYEQHRTSNDPDCPLCRKTKAEQKKGAR